MASPQQPQSGQPASPGRRHSSATPEIVHASAASDRGSPSRQSNPFPRRFPVRPDLIRPQTIRLRRLPSTSIPRLETIQSPVDGPPPQDDDQWQANRRRSSSEPQRPSFNPVDQAQTQTPMNNMPSVPELPPNTDVENYEPAQPSSRPATANAPPGPGRLRRMSTAALGGFGRNRTTAQMSQLPPELEYDPRIVDLLDVIDPEVSTLNSLTNVQNSLFVPDLGRFVNRSSAYQLSRRPPRIDEPASGEEKVGLAAAPTEPISRQPTATTVQTQATERPRTAERPHLDRTFSITSVLSENRHAVLPHGISLEGWSEEEKLELDDHVRHMLHSRRSRIKRSLRGFGKYVSTPLGFLVTLYATLITLFGLAWVLFLIGWIYVGNKQLYIINIIDNVLVALFAIVGDGLAPFRVIDTYHMIYIAHYHRLTWKIRQKKKLPSLENENDLPEQTAKEEDVETGRIEKEELSVLTEKQQKKLEHHQKKFCKSHTFYKPHETETHFAFPLRLLVAVVILLDLHSCFQIALGACTWGIPYKTRPQALTATILCCSITVNITAGIVISVGDRMSRKKDVIERMSRQELTEEAIKKMEKRQEKQEDRMRAIDEDPEGEQDARKGRMSLDVFRKSLDVTRGRKSMDKKRTLRTESSNSGSASGEESFSLKSPTREIPEEAEEDGQDNNKTLAAEAKEQPQASSSRSSMPLAGKVGSSSSD